MKWKNGNSVLQCGTALLLLLCLMLFGCKTVPAAAAAIETPVVLTEKTPLVTPTPSETPEPDMMVDDNGNITLGSALSDTFLTALFPFDHAPRVLIYHTHATEAYQKGQNDTYEETEMGRTNDTSYNIVALGDELAQSLQALGFSVIHDTTDVESPDLLQAYSRSLAVMEQYEDIDIYIDLHRNAASVHKPNRDGTVLVDGETTARMFFVVGMGIGTYEGEYEEAPDWEQNYTIALSVTQALENIAPGITRPVRLKVGRYNQHMGLCLLAEVGTNAQSLAQAKNAIPLLAEALKTVFPFSYPS